MVIFLFTLSLFLIHSFHLICSFSYYLSISFSLSLFSLSLSLSLSLLSSPFTFNWATIAFLFFSLFQLLSISLLFIYHSFSFNRPPSLSSPPPALSLSLSLSLCFSLGTNFFLPWFYSRGIIIIILRGIQWSALWILSLRVIFTRLFELCDTLWRGNNDRGHYRNLPPTLESTASGHLGLSAIYILDSDETHNEWYQIRTGERSLSFSVCVSMGEREKEGGKGEKERERERERERSWWRL